MPGFKTLKTLKTPKTPQTLQFPRGSCHQALSSSPFGAPALQPALCLHIPRGSFHQAPGRQRSSIAACPLPAHSPLLLGHSSLPFAIAAAATKPSHRHPLVLQGCSLPFACTSLAAASTKLLAVSVPALQPALCLHTGFKTPKSLKPSNSLAAAATKPSHRHPLVLQRCSLPLPAHPSRQLPPSSWPSAFQHCSLPFACTQHSLVRAFKPAVCQASNP